MYISKNCLILIICIVSVRGTEIDELHRSKRQLLFPNTTLLQFNAGVGTPSPVKNINFNYAFQANFQLPWNRTQVPTDILHVYSGYDGTSRKKREGYENDAKLFHFYKYVEEVLNSFGHDGHTCVKKALCQIGTQPLHSNDEEDLLHELASFVLNPTNDVDPDNEISEQHETYPYIQAHKHGQDLLNCVELYKGCEFYLVDMFSQLQNES